MKLVDTSVVVDHLRGVRVATDLLLRVVEAGEELAASEIVRFELLSGVRASEVEALETFFTVVTWMPVDSLVARVAGRLARRFRRTHSGIDDADYLIAATALILEAELLTKNVRHFPMLPHLAAPY